MNRATFCLQLPPPDDWGRTPLHIATKYGYADLVKLLIENGANVNVEDDKRITPLLLAGTITNGDVDNLKSYESIVEVLLKNGANVNKKNYVTGA